MLIASLGRTWPQTESDVLAEVIGRAYFLGEEMTYQVLGDDGRRLDAHAEVDSTGVTFHSRGGSSARGSVRNADYSPALRLLLRRLASGALPFDRAWVDSSWVQYISIEDRTILRSHELDSDGSSAFTLASNRMKIVGQKSYRKGGNSTKRIRIQFTEEVQLSKIEAALQIVRIDKDLSSAERLPAELFNSVTAEHVWKAIERLRQPNFKHRYGSSTHFDLLTDSGERFPPTAVFGIAATEALGFEVLPKHCTAHEGSICFRVLERSGYIIAPKNGDVQRNELPISADDRLWAEGKPRLIAHLRRERRSGLAQAKKDWYVRTHGSITCEKCGMDPIEVYGGPHGIACIEVHHHSVRVEDMTDDHQTKLDDLQCLCANCHRVEHRLLKLALERDGSTMESGVARA